MQRMSFITGLSTSSESGQKAYESLFDTELNASSVEALKRSSQPSEQDHVGSSGDERQLLRLHCYPLLCCLPLV
jgi:hypothetical protein